jgi:aminobenzoyl-glutamate transport protein
VVLRAPRRLITFAVVGAGVFSHVASEAGYVVLIPLAAAMFLALGRHPMAGLAAAFSGVSGGFGANFVITAVDPVLAGLSQSAAQLLDASVRISPAANLYFMGASAVLVTLGGTWVTERIVEPRLGPYSGPLVAEPLEALGPKEWRGLLWAGLSLAVLFAALAATTLPADGLLRHPGEGVLRSAFFNGLITAILLAFLVPGLAYGIAVGTIRSDKDVVKQMVSAMSHMASYIVLVFFAAQFVYSFGHSNLGLVLAIDGAELLRSIGLTGVPLMVAFVLLSATINMFMGSVVFGVTWTLLMVVWMLLGLPVGPDGPLHYAPAAPR